MVNMRTKILIVDDSPYNLMVLKETIIEIDSDIDIHQSLNGEDAIE